MKKNTKTGTGTLKMPNPTASTGYVTTENLVNGLSAAGNNPELQALAVMVAGQGATRWKVETGKLSDDAYNLMMSGKFDRVEFANGQVYTRAQ
ncbi:hypothetical protein FACS189421_10940 [Bacteroidia bacterium]|nr:hypothetical protein FACS189421_10940 [Bacteroidia bacterium]